MNVKNPTEYNTLFPALIKDWRIKFNQGNIPFIYVQLANFMEAKTTSGESSWAALRQAQLNALSLPNTGMAVAIDIGEWNDIHALDKYNVGHRLALQAEHAINKFIPVRYLNQLKQLVINWNGIHKYWQWVNNKEWKRINIFFNCRRR